MYTERMKRALSVLLGVAAAVSSSSSWAASPQARDVELDALLTAEAQRSLDLIEPM